jgi:hypothetical protein
MKSVAFDPAAEQFILNLEPAAGELFHCVLVSAWPKKLNRLSFITSL